jgi:hypothetical protein
MPTMLVPHFTYPPLPAPAAAHCLDRALGIDTVQAPRLGLEQQIGAYFGVHAGVTGGLGRHRR